MSVEVNNLRRLICYETFGFLLSGGGNQFYHQKQTDFIVKSGFSLDLISAGFYILKMFNQISSEFFFIFSVK